MTRDQLERLVGENGNASKPLEDLLQETGLLTSETILSLLADFFKLPIVDLRKAEVPSEIIRLIPAALAQKHTCVPIALEGRRLTLAVSNPGNPALLSEAAFASGCKLTLVLAPREQILSLIEEKYDVTVEKMVEGMNNANDATGQPEEYFIHDLQEKASEPTLINLVNLIISEAIQEGASDIHIEPFEKEMKIKYRVDGILQEVPPPPKQMQPAIVSRIKIMAGMDIAKRHIPQDGYIRINLQKGQVDIRVATVPTIFGEGVVMRLLNKSAILISLEELGFSSTTYERFEPLLSRSYGIILVCGPTGSGKTTTLYAVLNKIFTPEKKIITIEDPVEYQLTGVNQIPVRPARGVTFASGLRSVLRLDPDILLVGEIRDVETAEIAIRSALTGHLIFSTLHTNDAASSVTRLIDMGIEPYLIASSLQGALAQRLVRRLCQKCREPFVPEPHLLGQFDKTPADAEGITFYRPRGCDACRGRGYDGRLAIFELLLMTEELENLINRHASSHEIKAAARRTMRTMREDGWEKICAGQTTFQEIFRQTQSDQSEVHHEAEALDEVT